MADEVTLAELVRVVMRLEGTVQRQQDLYVLTSVYHSERDSLARRIDGLEREIEADRADRKADRRLLMGSFVLPFILILLNLAFLARGV